jgi:hypothetical protein
MPDKTKISPVGMPDKLIMYFIKSGNAITPFQSHLPTKISP